MSKKCSRCGVWKPVTEYARKKGSADGYTSECKECRHDVRMLMKRKKQIEAGV